MLLPLLLLLSWHNIATTQLEAELDAESGALEVAMHLSPNDLETCLSGMTNRAVRLDKEEDLDALITQYLKAHLSISNSKSEVAPFTWVGKEIELRDVWIYFELDVEGSLQGKKMRNDLLTGLHHDYVSTMSLRLGDCKVSSLRFDRETKEQVLLSD